MPVTLHSAADLQCVIILQLLAYVVCIHCRFVDPTNDVTGLSRYRKALTILFDPAQSEVRFKGIHISGPGNHIATKVSYQCQSRFVIKSDVDTWQTQ